jgi:dynactin complex subunit
VHRFCGAPPPPSLTQYKGLNILQVRDVEGYRANVKYIGAIANAKPEEGWIGVEWDDPSRGKHDGQAYGRRYFTTQPGRGSFVRAEKLVPRLGLDEAVFLK